MRRVVAALCLALAVLAQAGAAHAHASLVRSEPSDGAMVAHAPPALRLVFNEPVSALVMRLVRADGAIVPLKATRSSDGVTLSVSVPSDVPDGTNLLSWRVVSADGHPVGGSLRFSIGASGATPAVPQSDDRLLLAAIWLTRLIVYAGLFVGVGGVFFAAWFAPGSRRPDALPVVLSVGVVAALLSAGLHGADLMGLTLTQIGQPDAWQQGMSSAYGLTLTFAALALALALAATSSGSMAARIFSLMAMAGVGLALAASGHAATAGPEFITRPAVFVHALCVTFWLGALLPLALALRVGDDSALMRFSHAIPIPFVLLVATGVLLAVIQMRDPAALVTTTYGRVLSCKLAVVVLLLGLAVSNRRLTSRVVTNDVAARRRLRVSILIELSLMVVILGLVATWRFTPPPRALLATAGEPVYVHLHGTRAMAEAYIEPGRSGARRMRIELHDGELRPLAARELAVVFSKPDAGIEPMILAAEQHGEGWRVNGIHLPLPGRWRLRIAILVNDFDEIELEDDIEVPR